MISIKNKNVLITGGSRGIGKACVEIFLNAGANVAFTYNSAEEEANQIISNHRGTTIVSAYKVNFSRKDEIEKLAKKVLADFDGIDVLVNNAGIWKEAAIDNMTFDEWNEMININLTATYMITKLVVPGMKQKQFGRIINIASTAGQMPDEQAPSNAGQAPGSRSSVVCDGMPAQRAAWRWTRRAAWSGTMYMTPRPSHPLSSKWAVHRARPLRTS